MKKVFAAIIGTIVLFVGGVCSASTTNGTNDFNLIEYCETHEIHSRGEFQAVLDYYVPQGESSNSSNPIDCEELSFELYIDYDNQTVSTDTLYLTDTNRGTKSGSVSREVYSSLGIKLYTITVHGTFSYSSNNVSTTSASGSFTPAPLSLWTSTPVISSGKINDKAFARISGTASILGGTTRNYSLTLTCDTNGTLDSY